MRKRTPKTRDPPITPSRHLRPRPGSIFILLFISYRDVNGTRNRNRKNGDDETGQKKETLLSKRPANRKRGDPLIRQPYVLPLWC
jgi:hypothetical protein